MTEDTSPENLRKFLESDDPALVRMGLSMAKGADVKVAAEDIQNILIGNDGANLSLGLEFAKEVGIEDEAIEIIISTIDPTSHCDDSLMDKIISSNNEKAIDALIDYASDYEERFAVVQFFSQVGVSQLNSKQKKELKILAEVSLDSNECLDRDSTYEAENALVILETIGDYESLRSFDEVEDGACYNTNKYECASAETNRFTIQDKLATVTSKILSEEKDKTKVINYLNDFLKHQFIDPRSDDEEVQETVESAYPYFIDFLNLRTMILEGLKTEDKDIISVIKKVKVAIDESISKHPEPSDFDYDGYAGY